MRRIIPLLTFTSVTLVVIACASTFARTATTQKGEPPLHLSGAASSREELVDWWLDALAHNDEKRLHSLRVSREEYMAILVPWTVKPGEPPRQVSQQPREFFWNLVDTKSRDLGSTMLQEHGGKRYQRKQLTFSQPPKEYAGYTAHGLVRVEVATDAGAPQTVEGPWIAEVAGRYKFIGLDWTD